MLCAPARPFPLCQATGILPNHCRSVVGFLILSATATVPRHPGPVGASPVCARLRARQSGNHKGCPYGVIAGHVGRGNRATTRVAPTVSLRATSGAAIGQPQGLPLRWHCGPRRARQSGNHKGCPYGGIAGRVGRGNRATTRVAPTVALRAATGAAIGQPQGLPLRWHCGPRRARQSGNHKGCPYRGIAGHDGRGNRATTRVAPTVPRGALAAGR